MLLFCADNGIVEEGVTQSGQEVTLAVAKSMARKGSSVCRMAQSIGAETIPVDIGINSEESIPGVWNCKVCVRNKKFLKRTGYDGRRDRPCHCHRNQTGTGV